MNEQENRTVKENNKSKLVLRVNFFVSLFAIAFSLLCYFYLGITKVVPQTLMVYGLLNMGNTFMYRIHGNLPLTYNITSILTLIAATLITLYSGGILSPFIFTLGLIIVAGYASTNRQGNIYLLLIMAMLVPIYILSSNNSVFYNVVPEASRNVFALISVLFSTYVLGGIFGKYLLNAHNKLYDTHTNANKIIKEKDTMLKEVYHRVKNNLQTVSSLMNLQSRNIEEEKIKNILKSTQNRVITMSLVHEMLYMRDDISKIEFKKYVEDLTEYLVRSVKGTQSNIDISIDIPDLKLNVDTAIPLGLMINEIVTNALKYGFPDNEQGNIQIQVAKLPDNLLQLDIGDDGVGFHPDTDYKTSKSLGLKLIHNLTRQLLGEVNRDHTKKGTYYTITFREINQEMPTSLD